MCYTVKMDDDVKELSPEEAIEALERMSALRRARITVPRTPKFSRSEVVTAFNSAFEMIGGIPRLALWANENPTEFYRLFGKLLPSASIAEIITRSDDAPVRTYSTLELEEMLAEAGDVEVTYN